MELFNLRDLLHHELEDLYSAEEQIIEALPKMVEKASQKELKKVLHEHLKVTLEQKKRLGKIFDIMKMEGSPREKKGILERIFGSETKCKGTEGLIKEGEKMMSEEMDSKVMDAVIIGSAQKIEHYEIAGYGTARAYARELGLTSVAKLLDLTLEEEYLADGRLTSLAVKSVNLKAERPAQGLRKRSGLANRKKSSKRPDPAIGTHKAGRSKKMATPKKAVNKKK
ncbi:MAG: hypothetical protein NVSMB67_20520 [Flavisolibacter sp.]